jgi:AcrR family transcriptional regulator
MAPKAGLTRERIADAALELLHEQPDRALTMRLLATHLNVDPMALYRHVRDKRDLVELMSDHALRDGLRAGLDDLPPNASTREFAASTGRSLHAHLVANPELIPIVATAPITMTSARYGIEIVVRLINGGVGERTAITCLNAVVAFAMGSALLTLEPLEPSTPIDSRELAETLSASGSQIDAASIDRMLTSIDGYDFEVGLDAILTGFLGPSR